MKEDQPFRRELSRDSNTESNLSTRFSYPEEATMIARQG
jgi:hypothetical protein